MTQPGLGDVTFAGFGRESTWGTPVGITDFTRIVSETLKLNKPRSFPPSYGGAARRIQVPHALFVDGGIETLVGFEGLDVLFKDLLGAAASAQVAATSAYTHTITPIDSYLASLSIEIDRDKKAATYEGCKVASASFSQGVNDPLRATWNIIGENEVLDTATAETFPASLPVLDSQFTFELADASGLIKGWTMDINNNPSGAERADLGAGFLKEPVRSAQRTISGTFTAEFDAETFYTAYTTGAAIKLEFLYAGAIIEAANTYELSFTLPEVYLISAPPNVGDIGPIIQTLQWEAIYDEGTPLDELTIVLQNENTSII